VWYCVVRILCSSRLEARCVRVPKRGSLVVHSGESDNYVPPCGTASFCASRLNRGTGLSAEGAEARGPERHGAEHVATDERRGCRHRHRRSHHGLLHHRHRVRNVDVTDRVHELLERLVDRLRDVNVDLTRDRNRHRHLARDLHFLDLSTGTST